MIEELQKYRLMYEHCMNKIDGLLQEELQKYNQFLDEYNISCLPEGIFFYQGGRINREEVKKLYNEWQISAKNLENKK
jgi:hypothetical protein